MYNQFPDNFVFGIADSDLQVIGEQACRQIEQSEPTMWEFFARTSGRCHADESPLAGVERYHRWREDAALMEELRVRHYRTSISAARLLKRDGSVNGAAVRWYREYFTELKRREITIYAALHHWELPQYFSEKGGWLNREVVDLMARHAEAAAGQLGDLIDHYFLFNEPSCSAFLGYLWGRHAPGRESLPEALLAAHHILLAQGVMFETLRRISPAARISAICNLNPTYAQSADAEDVNAARLADEHLNGWFLDPLYLGKYPQVLAERCSAAMPPAGAADMRQVRLGAQLYGLGVNYYSGTLVRRDPKALLGFAEAPLAEGPRNALGWPILVPPYYPEGFYDLLQQVYYRYAEHGLRRLYITENGTAVRSEWDGRSDLIDDAPRVRYLSQHLLQVLRALKRGIPIEGYFVWTLLDNYEWAEGYRPESRFGLVYVDRPSMRRIKKTSALWYQALLQRRSLESSGGWT